MAAKMYLSLALTAGRITQAGIVYRAALDPDDPDRREEDESNLTFPEAPSRVVT